MTMSPNIPGDLLILAALVCNLIAGYSYSTLARGGSSLESLAKRSYLLFTVLSGLAVAYLYFLFYSHNYAIKYVFEYSQRAQPAFYILSAFWGGQEGTYLLWLFFNALFGYIILRRGAQYTHWAMVVYSIINCFFLFILVKLSPFALLDQPAADGLGLNPLLRDPWMVIHPPVIFVGYAMASVPFAIAMAALILRDFSDWLKRVFPWVAITGLALGAGNILGAFWAYKTLGWGGYWAWDPVENSSFVPWVISLALTHGLLLEKRAAALRKTNILLTSLVFLLVIYGTFLTRSGVLADFSVHSFTDLGINGFLVGFMVLFVLITLVLFLWRAKGIPSEPLNYNFYGREFSLFAGMILLFLFGLVILVWTSLPLLTRVVGAEPRAADLSTYNGFAIPLSILMALIVAVAPLVDFNEFRPSRWLRKLVIYTVGSAVIGFGLFYAVLNAGLLFASIFTIVFTTSFMYLQKRSLVKSLAPGMAAFAVTIGICLWAGVTQDLFILFFATAAMAIVTNGIALSGYFPSRWKLVGGQLTHFGYGLLLIGVLASSAYSTSDKLVLAKGETGKAYNRTIGYNGMAHDITYPNNELLLTLGEDSQSREIRPQLYFSQRMQGQMRKPYVERSLMYDLYLAPEQLKAAEHEETITLTKGEKKQLGAFDLVFTGFSMGQHDNDSNSGMKVGAKLSVTCDGQTAEIEPAIVHVPGVDGKNVATSQPAVVSANGIDYTVEIDKILADQGAVAISIPGLTGKEGGDLLVLDITKKPIINLVWAGAILIMVGSVIVFIRRRGEIESGNATYSAQLSGIQSARSATRT